MRRSAVVVAVLGLLGIAPTAFAETAPVALDDYAETDGKTVQIYVLANDSGDIDPSTLTLVSEPAQGNAAVIATGAPRIKYSASGSGADTFQYSICSSAGACSTATVIVNIGVVATTTSVLTTTTVASTQPPTTTTTLVIAAPSTTAPLATTATPPASAAPATTSTTPSSPSPASTTSLSDPLANLAVASDFPLAAAGTTVGESHMIDVIEDVLFLGRSGADTLKLVAVPAVMVSGIVGFLLIGLPQNALAGLLGFLVAKHRRDKEKRANPET